ncbi:MULTISPECIES: endonuclease/exonuclease/phosphatase family protein [unclassified Nonomuraea]|uniref:endonuclease/exonuclease/phosphatase family protein n=1 Tax=unclassified Nonomuraea TaxID=2593643 RepID=UPI0033DF355E
MDQRGASATAERASAGKRPSPRRRRRWFAWTVVALLAAWAALRVGGLETGSFLIQLMTVTPIGAGLAALTALLAMLRRNRPAGLSAALVGMVFIACLIPRTSGVEAGKVIDGVPLRVLSVNLFGRADAETVVRLVRTYEIEVFSALELTPEAVRRLDQAGLRKLLPYRVLQAADGAIGSGLFARHPLRPRRGLFTPIGHNMPAATLSLPSGGKVEVVAVHPNPPLGRMADEWDASLKALPSPSPSVVRILAGDFNASLDHRAFRDLLARGYVDAADQVGKGLVPTWPNGRAIPPIITIDHVLADRRVGVARTEILDVPGTDHRGVFADLRLPAIG